MSSNKKSTVKVSNLSNKKAELVFGFLGKVCDTTVALARVNASVLKYSPKSVLRSASAIEEKCTDYIIESSAKAEDFMYNVLNTETVKTCAARLAEAATDRLVRQMKEAPLPHERKDAGSCTEED